MLHMGLRIEYNCVISAGNVYEVSIEGFFIKKKSGVTILPDLFDKVAAVITVMEMTMA